MKIILENIGKRYNAEWIFRGINLEFDSGKGYVILGANGSGKSTLLQLVGGNISSSDGKIAYHNERAVIDNEKIFKEISFAAPYLELPEEMTLTEIIQFHFRFKKLHSLLKENEVAAIFDLKKASNKQLKYFSSGMKQRVRLGLAIVSVTPVLLLDEPLSNLDKKGSDWYISMIKQYAAGRLIIVCSNHQEKEYEFCTEKINIEDYKISR